MADARGRDADDLDVLLEGIETHHSDPWYAISEEDFRDEAEALAQRLGDLDDDGRLVELMRLTALLGERDGPSGIYPLDPTHDRELSLYPLRLYRFADELVVVAAADESLVGARVERIAGTPAAEVEQLVAPLVPADNDWSRASRVPHFALVAEVLHGLGVTESARDATFTFRLPDGSEREETLVPVTASEYANAYPDIFIAMVPPSLPERPEPAYLGRRMEQLWWAKLDGGRALYIGYNVTLPDTDGVAAWLRRSARRPEVERVILDLRLNPGGNNGTYVPLLEELRSPAVDRPGRLFVLTSRATFSAAGNLAAELDATTDALFVGEPTGGAPNQWCDPQPVYLPASGWTVHVPTRYWEKSTPDDERLAIEPDIPVELTAEDFLSGRDPVLSAALRRAPR